MRKRISPMKKILEFYSQLTVEERAAVRTALEVFAGQPTLPLTAPVKRKQKSEAPKLIPD